MAAFNAKPLPLAAAIGMTAAIGALMLPAPGGRAIAAEAHPKEQPIVLDAQSADGNLADNVVVFHKVRIVQGEMAITADQGQGTQQKQSPDADAFENSVWNFRGNVRITMDRGQLNSDDARINFVKRALSTAVANGKPATFEQRIVKTGKVAQGHADTIDYDAAKGLVHLSKNAWLSDGSTEIRGESLKYNMLAQSIVADEAEQGSQRVHIIITPPPSKP